MVHEKMTAQERARSESEMARLRMQLSKVGDGGSGGMRPQTAPMRAASPMGRRMGGASSPNITTMTLDMYALCVRDWKLLGDIRVLSYGMIVLSSLFVRVSHLFSPLRLYALCVCV